MLSEGGPHVHAALAGIDKHVVGASAFVAVRLLAMTHGGVPIIACTRERIACLRLASPCGGRPRGLRPLGSPQLGEAEGRDACASLGWCWDWYVCTNF